ncbi:hypothetical protein C9374_008359 [Naegleria lovaniensis]|uniref:Uncharacterized protein n=1 Tax=Naegleria lovaniensis TaxID=51637 RepID=A0AA88GKN1_NAELO|nr:uncharacterized protein C9374_008359 [Naegleria lovaniensis]KAG2378216.1 hypothetical protein C9374_008359 [Naegleria lovaniensis]
MDPQCRLKPYPGQVALFIHPGNLTVAEYEQEQKRKQKEDLQRKSELVGYVMGGVLVGCILIVIVVGIVGYLWYQRRWINYLRQESKPSSLEEHHEMYEEIHSQKVDRMELSDE